MSSLGRGPRPSLPHKRRAHHRNLSFTARITPGPEHPVRPFDWAKPRIEDSFRSCGPDLTAGNLCFLARLGSYQKGLLILEALVVEGWLISDARTRKYCGRPVRVYRLADPSLAGKGGAR